MSKESDSAKIIKDYVFEDNEKAKERIGLAFDVYRAFEEIRKEILVKLSKSFENKLKENFNSDTWKIKNKVNVKEFIEWPSIAIYKESWCYTKSRDHYSICLSSDRKSDFHDLLIGVTRPQREVSTPKEEEVVKELNKLNLELVNGGPRKNWVWFKFLEDCYRYTRRRENLLKFHEEPNYIAENIGNYFNQIKESAEGLIDQCVEEANSQKTFGHE